MLGWSKLIGLLSALNVFNFIRFGGAKTASFGKRTRGMVQLLLFMLTGLGVAFAAFWWANAVRETYFAGRLPPKLGAVVIHNPPDALKGDALTAEFPRLILSEIHAQQVRANNAMDTLKRARGSVRAAELRPGDIAYEEIRAPASFTEALNVDLKVAEVDVGKILSLLSSRTSDANQLKINIVFDNSKAESIVYGSVVGRPEYRFSVKSGESIQDIIQAAASAIIHLETTGRDGRFESISADALNSMFKSLADFAKLEKSVFEAKHSRVQGYSEIVTQISGIAADLPTWPELQWLAASAAEKAGDFSKALIFAQNLRNHYLLPTGDKRESEFNQAQLQQLEAKIDLFSREVTRLAAVKSAVAVGAAAESLPYTEAALSALAAFPAADEANAIRQRLGLLTDDPGGRVLIGVVGVPSVSIAEALEADLGAAGASPDLSLDSYVASVASTIRLIAPGAEFAFAGPTSDAVAASVIIEGVSELSKSKVRIVLVTFGADLPRTRPGEPLPPTEMAYQNLVDSSLNEKLFVFAAGNSSRSDASSSAVSAYHSLADRALVVQSLGEDDQVAQYSSIANDGLWLPGQRVPTFSVSEGSVSATSGTSAAAALAAGLAAVLLEEFPDAKPPQVVAAMKSASGGPPERPVPLTYPKAKAALVAILKDAG